MNIISVIGSFASIFGAIWAFEEARHAAKAANKAIQIKDQLISHRKTSELAVLHSLLNTAIFAFKKYGVSNSSSLTGINHNSDAKLSLDFIHKLKEFREYFNSESGNVADECFNKINDELAKFKNVTTSQEISLIGTTILNILVGFAPFVKSKSTLQKEHTV